MTFLDLKSQKDRRMNMLKEYFKIAENNIITDIKTDKRYRILYIMSKDNLVLIEMDTTKFNVFMASMNELIKWIGTKYIISPHENKVVDKNLLSKKQWSNFQWRKQFVDELQKLYGPSYLDLIGHTSKEEFKSLYSKYGIVKSYAWKITRMFLQSGFDYSILVHTRKESQKVYKQKTGRKGLYEKGVALTPEIEKIFEDGFNQYKTNPNVSFQLVYDRLCFKYFSNVEDEYLKFCHKMKDRHIVNFITIAVNILAKKKWKKSKHQKQNTETILVFC